MSNGLTKTLSWVGAIAAAVAIVYLLDKVSKQGKIISELELKSLNQLKDSIEDEKSESNSVSIRVDKQIRNLIEHFKNRHPSISDELETALNIYESNEKEKAVGSINICIENLISSRLKKSDQFKNWLKNKVHDNKRNPVYIDYLEFSYEENVLDNEEYEFANNIRKVRNKAYHNAGFKRVDYYNEANILVGLNLIYKLGNLSH